MSTQEIRSPIPGTFYTRETPTSDPFVRVGSTVQVGDTVALVEVMKMFNPVQSDVAGTVIEVCVENEDAVDAGDVLFRIEG